MRGCDAVGVEGGVELKYLGGLGRLLLDPQTETEELRTRLGTAL